jgi:hypothetical protein
MRFSGGKVSAHLEVTDKGSIKVTLSIKRVLPLLPDMPDCTVRISDSMLRLQLVLWALLWALHVSTLGSLCEIRVFVPSGACDVPD